jgi:hypothetical protein
MPKSHLKRVRNIKKLHKIKFIKTNKIQSIIKNRLKKYN